MELELSQKQALIPSLQTSLRILQMNNLQLRDYISDFMTGNAAVELTLPEIEYRPSPFGAHRSNDGDFSKEQFIADKAAEASEREDLLLQCAALGLPPFSQGIVQYLIHSLDQNGYLTESAEESARFLHVGTPDVEKCISILQSMEPAGVGASNLRECLRLQLEREPKPNRYALQIVEDWLPQLAKSQYGIIAKALGISQARTLHACEKICALNPKPLNGLGREVLTQFVLPDFYVMENEGRLCCQMNDYYLPKLRIDPTFRSFLRDGQMNPNDRDYLQKNIKQAQEVIGFMEYRKATLQRVVEMVLQIQEDFFRLGPGHRKPMSNRELARALSLHESTVSRAVSGKYFECKWGVFPLKSLFMHTVGSAQDDNFDQILQSLRQVIAQEPCDKPFSDQKIAGLLAEKGILIARRTVAKYRQHLNIPPASKRRSDGPKGRKPHKNTIS